MIEQYVLLIGTSREEGKGKRREEEWEGGREGGREGESKEDDTYLNFSMLDVKLEQCCH